MEVLVLVDEMVMHMEAKTGRRDSGQEGDGFRTAGFATIGYCTRNGGGRGDCKNKAFQLCKY